MRARFSQARAPAFSPGLFGLFLALAVLSLGGVARATSYAWANAAGGKWSVSANWSPSGVPGGSDTASITMTGNYTVTNDAAQSIGTLTLGDNSGNGTVQTLKITSTFTVNNASTGTAQGALSIISGGTLAGAGSLTLAGPLNWTGGTITGIVNFSGGSFSGSTALTLNSGQLANSGTLNWSDPNWYWANGALLTNTALGTINLTGNFVPANNGGAVSTFANAGQLNVTVSGTANIENVTFNNSASGTVAVNGGTLELSGGGTEDGQFTAAAGATLEVGGGTFTFNGDSTISGAGTFTVSGVGTANFTGTCTITPATNNITGGTNIFSSTGTYQPGALNMSGGTLEGAGTVAPKNAGGFTWTGGQIGNGTEGNGIVNFIGGSFSGSTALTLNGGQLTNSGTLNWSDPNWYWANGALLTNTPAGTINLTGNFVPANNGGAVSTFANAGQLNVTVSGTANIENVTFNNSASGTVAVNGGTLELSGGGTEDGQFTAAAGATLEVGGGTFTFNGDSTISGAGIFTVSGGTANFTGTCTITPATNNITGGTANFSSTGTYQPGALNMSGGTLEGAGTVAPKNAGGFTWTGGTIGNGTAGNGIVNFIGGSFSGSTALTLNGGQLTNSGTLNWSDPNWYWGNGALLTNTPAGTINLTGNFVPGPDGGAASTFANAGQLNVTVIGTANIENVTFNNSASGTVAVNGGALELSGGGTEDGQFTAAAGATLEVGGSAFTFNGDSTISGAGIFTVSGGTANFTGTATLTPATNNITGGAANFSSTGTYQPGALNLSGGTLEGAGTVAPKNAGGFTWTGGTIGNGTAGNGIVNFIGGSFSGSTALTLNGGQLTNSGTLNWSDPNWYWANGALLTNTPAGTINLTGNFVPANNGGAVSTFANAGQLNVTVNGTGTIEGVTFNNTGTVTVSSGTLALNGTHNLAGGTLNFGLNSATSYGQISIPSGAAGLTGTLTATLEGGFIPVIGNSWQVLSYGSQSGVFTQTNLPTAFVWQTTEGSASYTIKVLQYVPQFTWVPASGPIVYGTPLGGSQFYATAAAPFTGAPLTSDGTLTYSPPAGTILPAGTGQSVTATFTPNTAGVTAGFASASNTKIVTVSPLPVVLTGSRVYDGTATAAYTILSVAHPVGSDVVTVASGSATLAGAGPGVEAITSFGSLTLGGAQGANYTLSGASGSVTIIPLLTIGSVTMPNGATGTGFSQTLAASGGNSSYTWSVSAGSLPPGLSLNVSSGVLSGTPTATGTYPFTVQVTSGSQTASEMFTITVTTPTTIDLVNHYAYGANIGWMDWRGNTLNGAVIGQYFCSGYIYSANVGWINLGGGSPVSGNQYQNNSATDFGVNVDSQGNLRGYAYGANIGWINFENTGAPQVNLQTGVFSGYVWSANCGWISLNNSTAHVQTARLAPTITTGTSLPTVTVNTPDYMETLTATGGNSSYTWSASPGSLPPGLSLSSAGVLMGTPTAAGTYTFNVQVTSGPDTAGEPFTLIVANPSTIDPVNRYAYGANIGWMDWLGNTLNGAAIGQYFCSGFIYSANVGWINLGGGSPANGIQYQNNSATDFGVNMDSQGNLRGYAYGANIGWINFENTGAPHVNLQTGIFSGSVWSANCGWISLSNAQAYVQTDDISPGPLAPDGLPDAWLLLNFGTTSVDAGADPTGKGMTIAQDYLAGTDPHNASSLLRITALSFSSGGASASLTWESVPSRFYYLQTAADLSADVWSDSGLGLVSPSAGPTTTAAVTEISAPARFYRVVAVRPLTP